MDLSLNSALLAMRRGTSRPMSRDKADTLLLLVSCGLVIAPHTAHLPIWTSIQCAALLLWRGWLTFRGLRMPPKWLLLSVSVIALGTTYLSFHRFFGREPGVAMVILLLGLKLLEMHAKRDLFVVVLVSFFVMLTNFFYSQSMGTAFVMVLALIATLTTQLSFQYTGAVPPFAMRLRMGAMILGLAVPLSLVLFVLFPRIEGPLWSIPGDGASGRTGLSDHMSPGSITDLAQSDDIAFRVKFIDPIPPQTKLYWRALIFDTYDGHTWTHSDDQHPQIGRPDLSVRGDPVRYQVTQEPTGQRWLFALDLPHSLPALQGNPATFSKDMQTMALRPINDRVRYDFASYPDYTLQANQSRNSLLQWLQLPINSNPKARAFANQLRAQSSDNAALADNLLQYFHGQHFSYTLQPPLLGDDAIDEFLFSTQAGFCEHYAGAFVFLMRAMGVPARVVTGYQGGEVNPVDGYMEVRQSDAHAWAEIWLEQRGWVRYDPTAAVAPERIQRNLVSVIPRTTLGGLITLHSGKESLLSKLRFNWEAVNNAWNQWVLNYSPEKQRGFLQSLGLKNVDWENMIELMVIIGAGVVGIMSLPLMINRQKKDPLQNVYLSLCQVMARAGYPREKYEGPRDYRLRLIADNTKLTPTRKNAIDRFLRLYESLRYADLQVQQSKSGFTQLKSLLSECK